MSSNANFLLPTLSSTPHHFLGCCLGLSETLVEFLLSIINSVSQSATNEILAHHDRTAFSGITVLSIGSGTGLFEALLQRYVDDIHPWETRPDSRLRFEGVEVYSSTAPLNKYLSEHRAHIVGGTWDICQRAFEEDVKVWLFVYPRQPTLVKVYCEKLRDDDFGVGMIIWAGPKNDWDDYEIVFQELPRWDVEVFSSEQAGVMNWETVVVVRKNSV